MKEPTPQVALWRALVPALKNATAAVAIVAIFALALILAGCAVDQEKVARTRGDLEALCKGAITAALRAACERAGVDTTPSLVVP